MDIAKTVNDLLLTVVPKSRIGEFPSLDAEGLAVRIEEGKEITRFFGTTAIIQRPTIRLTARSKEYSIAEGWLSSAKSVLHGHIQTEFGIVLDSPPRYLGRDDQKIHEFQAIYKVLLKE